MSSGDQVTYDVVVNQVFKGITADRLEIRSSVSGGSCGLEGMLPGRRYLFFATTGTTHEPTEKVSADMCGGTASASADLVSQVEAVTGPGAPPETEDLIAPTSYQLAVAATGTKGGDWALPLALVAGGGLTVLVAGLWLRYGRR